MDSTCFDLKGTRLYAKDPLGWGRVRREKPDEFDTNEKKEPDIVGEKEREREKEGGMGVARMKKMERSTDQFVEKF